MNVVAGARRMSSSPNVGDDVVAVAADDEVVAVAAFQPVVAAVAPEGVVAEAGDEDVVASVPPRTTCSPPVKCRIVASSPCRG